MHRNGGYPAPEVNSASSFIGLALSGIVLLLGTIFIAEAASFGPSHEPQPCGIVRGARGEVYNTCP